MELRLRDPNDSYLEAQILDFGEGFFLGDFSDAAGPAKEAGQALGGFIPGWDTIGNARDISHSALMIYHGEENGWAAMRESVIGLAPDITPIHKRLSSIYDAISRKSVDVYTYTASTLSSLLS